MSTHFKLDKVTDLKGINGEVRLEESDFSLFTSDDRFLQFSLVEEDKAQEKYHVTPGIFAIGIKMQKYALVESGFTEEKTLDEYLNTKVINDKIKKFFAKIDVYKELGIFPKRSALLYGAPGCGKSALLSKVAREYAENGDTVIVIWPTDKFEARHVKDFICSFEYAKEVKKFILIMEDLGGIEAEGRGKFVSEASLLALLDNVEKTFTIPTMILATTNFPENFLENITDRPQRFDDVVEVPRPNSKFRSQFLEFFANGKIEIDQNVKDEIAKREYEGFSIAHIKECVVRALIYDISILEALNQVKAQSAKAKSEFSNRKKISLQ